MTHPEQNDETRHTRHPDHPSEANELPPFTTQDYSPHDLEGAEDVTAPADTYEQHDVDSAYDPPPGTCDSLPARVGAVAGGETVEGGAGVDESNVERTSNVCLKLPDGREIRYHDSSRDIGGQLESRTEPGETEVSGEAVKVYELSQEQADATGFTAWLAESPVPAEDAEAHLQAVCETAGLIAPTGSGTTIEVITEIAQAAPNLAFAQSYKELAQRWRAADLKGSPHNAVIREEEFCKLLAKLSNPESPPEHGLTPQDIEPAYDSLIALYKADFAADEPYVTDVRDLLVNSLSDGTYSAELDHKVMNSLRAVQAIHSAPLEFENQYRAIGLGTAIVIYNPEGMMDTQLQGLTQKLLPALIAGDPQTDILAHGHGEEPSISSSGEFIYRAYTSEVTPANVNELLLRYRLTPTSDYHRLEQNRVDGTTINQLFPRLKWAVHRMEIGVHETLKSIVEYYTTGDDRALDVAVAHVGEEVRGRNYDAKLAELLPTGKIAPKSILVIDVLKRLVENTTQLTIAPPETNDPVLNERMQKLHGADALHKRATLQQALQHANASLLQQMEAGEIGIEPTTIAGLAWLEQESMKVVTAIDSFEDQAGAYREEWFKEVVRFGEFTNSPDPVSAAALQDFTDQLSRGSAESAYNTLTYHVERNFQKLVQTYMEYGLPPDVLSTTTLASVLQHVGSEWKPAQTIIGRRLKAELEKPAHLRRTGD